jgi:hypothetical protein
LPCGTDSAAGASACANIPGAVCKPFPPVHGQSTHGSVCASPDSLGSECSLDRLCPQDGQMCVDGFCH